MRLPKQPKGKPTAAQIEKSGIVEVLSKFNRMVGIALRCKQAGVPICETLGVKPWESPTCETFTDEQYAKLEAAIAAKGLR